MTSLNKTKAFLRYWLWEGDREKVARETGRCYNHVCKVARMEVRNPEILARLCEIAGERQARTQINL